MGILLFAVAQVLAQGAVSRALLLGRSLRFFTYAIYELTNLALIKGWPLKIVLVDIAWGLILCALVAASSFGIARWLV